MNYDLDILYYSTARIVILCDTYRLKTTFRAFWTLKALSNKKTIL